MQVSLVALQPVKSGLGWEAARHLLYSRMRSASHRRTERLVWEVRILLAIWQH